MIRRDLCDNAEKTNKPILTFATFLSKKETSILQSNIMVDLDKNRQWFTKTNELELVITKHIVIPAIYTYNVSNKIATDKLTHRLSLMNCGIEHQLLQQMNSLKVCYSKYL